MLRKNHFHMQRSAWTRALLASTSLASATLLAATPAVTITAGGQAVSITNPFAAEAHAAAVTLDSGHVDAFNVTADNGELKLDLKEDVTGSHVRHDPSEVTLAVKQSAYTDKTASIEGLGVSGYFLPEVQDQNLLWPGWDTLGVQGQGFDAVDINFTEVSGPGKVFLFGSGPFGGAPSSMLTNNQLELTSGAVRSQSFPAHTHANWLFEKPGRYSMTVQASAKNSQGEVVKSQPATYTWVVGNGGADAPASGDGTDGVSGAAGSPAAGGSATSSRSASAGGAATGTSRSTNAGSKSTASTTSTSGGATGGAAAPQCTKGQPALKPVIKDDRKSPPSWVSPTSLTFGLGDAAKVNLPQNLGPINQGGAWLIGATQQPGVPWLGVNTMHPELLSQTSGDVTFSLTSFSGPGNMFVYEQGNLGQVVGAKWFSGANGKAEGSHVVPRNSHVHPNWVFDKPGTYKVGLTQTATLKDGKKVSAPAVLTFVVGGGGASATSGHFDFGATVTTNGDCAAGGGSGAAGGAGGGSGSGSLANTGSTAMTLPIALGGLGIAVFGLGLLAYLRSMNLVRRP